MTVNQISIFLENKYGAMSEILGLLAQENIRIIAATVADTSEFGIMRMIVSDPQKAYTLLKNNNVSVNLTEVLAVAADATAGSFAERLKLFTGAGLNIEYMYCFSGKKRDVLVLRTSNRERALEIVRQNKLEYIGDADLPAL